MPGKRIDFDVVRKIALALPGVEESSLHGAPSLKLAGRLLTSPAIHHSAKPNSIVVRIGFEQRAELLTAAPSIYYVTAHYLKHPAVLVRLDQIDHRALKVLLDRAWQFASSKVKRNTR